MARLTPESVSGRKKVTATLDPIKVRPGDLTGRQMRTIEVVTGVRITRIDERSSDVMFAAALRSVIEGAAVDDYLDFPATELVNSVELLDDEEDEPGNS